MASTLGVADMGRKKTAKPSMVVRIDAEVGTRANIVAGFEGKALGVFISDELRSIVERKLLEHARKVVDAADEGKTKPSKR